MSEFEAAMKTGLVGTKPTMVDLVARSTVLSKMSRLRRGTLHLVDGDYENTFGGADVGPAAKVRVLDADFYRSILSGGALGAAESYIEGRWTSENLTAVVRLLLQNREVLEGMDNGVAWFATPIRRMLHWLNRNSRKGSRRNIAAHYDLGNEFFGLWLDKSLMYSSAIFPNPESTLEEAAEEKIDRICRKLALTPNDRVLEIGTGWGGFAIYAAKQYGCHITTATISREQHQHAQQAVAEAGLSNQVDVLLSDYRDLDGQYDKIVSIEMIEAVGHRYMDGYFQKCAELLKEDGMFLLQAITIADQRYDGALKSVDFIQKYIFPGGFLPSATAILESTTRSSPLRLFNLDDIGLHYAETLRHWRERFARQLPEIVGLGFDESFLRMWHYYFCYCEAAFDERAISDIQALFLMPGARRAPLPATD